jgi:hypothetical protein
MSLDLTYNARTEKIEFLTAFDEYCCLFDEICKVIMETFDLSDLLRDYRLVYFDYAYNLWINLNIHVTKRITEIIRHSSLNTLKIRIERHQRNITNKVESTTIEDDSKLLSLFINITMKTYSESMRNIKINIFHVNYFLSFIQDVHI